MAQAFTCMMANALGSERLDPWVQGVNASETTWDIPEWQQVCDFMDIMNQYGIANPFDSDYSNMIATFANGEAAMYGNGSWSLADVKAIDPAIKMGVMGYPVTENPDDAKLGVDIENIIAASAKQENPEALRKVLDYMADLDDGTGFLHLGVNNMNWTPMMPYSEHVDFGPAGDDFQNYINKQQTMPWLYNKVPKNYLAPMSEFEQAYMMGLIDRSAFADGLTQAWLERLE